MTRRVLLAPSGRAFDVEDGETVLDAGLRAGLALPFGCRSGSCGSCRVRLESGQLRRPPPPGLSRGEVAAGYILMCAAEPATDLELRLHQPTDVETIRVSTTPARVVSHGRLSGDVVRLEVQLPRGTPFRFLPGQYVDFLLDDGQRRSFSIANAPRTDGRLEFHLRVTPGGQFAHWVQDDMPERALLRFEGPLGAFYLREDSARPVLMMGGGTGFAPLKAMLERALPSAGGRPIHLFWGARTAADLYLGALAGQWARDHARFRYTPVLSEPGDDWDGDTGLVHESLLRAYSVLNGFEAYLAGPPAMVHAGREAFIAAGLDADHLFYDSFDYAFETWPAPKD